MDRPAPTVIANPRAAGGAVRRGLRALERDLGLFFPDYALWLTEGAGDGHRLGRKARFEGIDEVLIAGGDGTVSEVVDGLLSAPAALPTPTVSLLPMGTGGDLARTLGVPKKNRHEALKIARDGNRRAMDVGVMTPPGGPARHVANIVSFGLSGEVVRRVNASSKRLGALSFAWATLRSTLAYAPTRVSLRLDGEAVQRVDVQTLALANGRYFGGGMHVAPEARIDDGVWDIIAIAPVSVARLLLHGHRVYRGTHLQLPNVQRWRARHVEVLAIEGAVPLVEVDGEEAGPLRVGSSFELLPGALHVRLPADDEQGER